MSSTQWAAASLVHGILLTRPLPLTRAPSLKGYFKSAGELLNKQAGLPHLYVKGTLNLIYKITVTHLLYQYDLENPRISC